jgi:hypothetical protein
MEIKRFKVEDILVGVYQRPISRAHVNKIVQQFDERLLGLPVVSVRDNGSCFVVDGQHRVAALARLGIPTVECQVLRESDTKSEATLFVKVNTTKKGLSGVDKFFGLIEARNEAALSCNKLFRKYGWELVRGSTTRVKTSGELAMRPNGTTLAIFNEYPTELEISLSLLVEAFPADDVGLRAPEVAESLVSMNLIGGLTVAVDGWVRANQWTGALRQTTIEMLRGVNLEDFDHPPIPTELTSHSNAKRMLGAVALAISQRVAARSKKHSWKLAPEDIGGVSAEVIKRSFAVA